MNYSTDAQITLLISDIESMLDHELLASNGDGKIIRLRALLSAELESLYAVHSAAGEPKDSFVFRQGISSIVIGLGMTWGALTSNENGNVFHGDLLQSISYIQVGVASLLSAISTIPVE